MKRLSFVAAVAILGAAACVHHSLENESSVATSEIPDKGRPAERAPKRDKPGDAAAYWSLFTETERDRSPAEVSWEIEQQLRADFASRGGASDLPPLTFTDIGPGNFGGRVRAMVIDPSDNDTIVVGGVSGGVWKTEDRGITWRPIDDFLPNLAIASMVLDPDSPTRIFAGTGEGFFNADAMRGAGIFVSDDFGESWTQLPATTTPDFHYVNRLARVPSSNILIAATRTGIWRSTDLGVNWGRAESFTVTGRGFTDVKVDPTDSSHLLAYLYGATGGFPSVVRITAPGSIAGDYGAAAAAFGAPITVMGTTGDIEEVNDGTSTTSDACEPLVGFTAGNIAFIDRGGCEFGLKALNAENAGASAVIVANNQPGILAMGAGAQGGSVTIPAVMITQTDGATIRAEFGGTVTGSVLLDNSAPLSSFLAQSNDSGATWTPLDDTEGLPVSDYARGEIAFGADGVIYLSVANAADQTRGLWRSADGGANFAKTASNTPYIERQGWYDLAVVVDPQDSDIVLMGAVDQFRTTNAGTTITKQTFWNPGAGQIPVYVHADHHIYEYDPVDAGVLYTGTDGGIARSDDNGLTYEQLNNGLNIAQTYGLAVSPDGSQVIAGTQDNGSHLFFGSSAVWIEWFGGDGGYVGWDQQQSRFIYGATPFAGLFGSGNTGASAAGMNVPDTVGALFITPFVLDQNNGDRLMIGTDNVFLTANARSIGGATFSAATSAIGSISALAFDPHNSDIGYAATTGGRLYRVDGLDGSPGETAIDSGLPMNAPITRITVDPNDASSQTLYVTMGGFLANRVYKSTDGGANWNSIHSGLPNIPLFDVKVDPNNPDRLWLASELGLWSGTGNSTGTLAWDRYEYGMPHTRVIEVIWAQEAGADVLYATTHGRGTFKASPVPFMVSVDSFAVGANDCDGDNILDIGESGSLALTVTNTTGLTLSNLSLSLSTMSTGLTVPAMPIALSDLGPGASEQVFPDVSLTASDSCPGSAVITASLTSDLGTYDSDFTFEVQTDRTMEMGTFEDGAESVDTLMTVENLLGTNAFEQVSDNVNGGSFSWFAADIPTFADTTLTSPWFNAEAGGNSLTFDLSYDTEGDGTQRWDGAVLELRTRNGEWIDIGGLSTVPYDGPLFVNNSAPAREAWSGNQTAWRSASVDLGTIYTGEEIQFRFRMVCDESTAETGFYVDNIALTNVSWSGQATCAACSLVEDIFMDGFETP